LYLDGVEIGSLANVTGSLTTSTSLFLGKNASGNFYKGILDDVKILTTTFPPNEIAWLFDSDADGMPDWWEMKYFGNLGKAATGDEESGGGDGLNNLGEYQAGTNPVVSDTDGDGMRDGWEVLYGFNPLVNQYGTDDPDGDGLTNAQESQYNTNPNSRDSDSDGMSDDWEVKWGRNPTVWNNKMIDSDGDGMNDGDESLYGRNPNGAGTVTNNNLELIIFTPTHN
jgi:hypothetical protein